MTEQEAYIAVNMLSGIGPARLNTLLARFGTPRAVLGASRRELAGIPGIGDSLAEKLSCWEKYVDLKQELDLARRGGVELLTPADYDYPALLKELRNAPFCLYVRGKLPAALSTRSLGVVGTRSMSNYGERMARHLVEAAAFAGFVIVSGLAYGIDAAAHRAALNAGGKTVSVLGGGLARIQPQDHIPLAREIAENGAVVSEFPMETSPTRHTFPMRNRIISGLTNGTLVIEAGLNSGSMITANFALEQNRTLFAVPGQADDPRAAGCNALIRQGAVLVGSFEHILEEFEFLPGFGSSKNIVREDGGEFAGEGDAAASPFELPPGAAAVLALLAKGELSAGAIAEAAGTDAGEVSSLLVMLELSHKIARLPSGLYRIVR